MLESLCNKVAALKASHFTKERFQHKCFLMNTEKSLITDFWKNICKRLHLYLMDFSEQLVFREVIFQNSLSNVFISNFYWTLQIIWTASYEITLFCLLVWPSVCPSFLPSISFLKIGSIVFFWYYTRW